ncbi:MAG: DUF4041 domain-containing protein [Planctomycetes bacterium]|nr:DUF4041 domain-containing protein [Planctomycetota bacterium]NOG55458.1 DUF4041 domain-containing protein [Planctomycetota bacterium]
MTVILTFLLIIAVVACIALLLLWYKERTEVERVAEEGEQFIAQAQAKMRELQAEIEKGRKQVERLAKWTAVADADDKARELLASAQATVSQADQDARILTDNAVQQYEQVMAKAREEAARATSEAKANAKELADEARSALTTATEQASLIVEDANKKAEEIAGKAYDAVRNADLYERTAKAMKNTIKGYGDEYLKPASSLLDDLAEEFGHKDAGRQLKIARDHTKVLIKTGQASSCQYVEASRREGAERFVLDAFNGKVDSILSKVRHNNHGKLEQEIHDAFTIVNHGGRAFRDARITDEYLAARLAELKWAATAQELKKQEQEEQRRIREQIREEEKARREYEKAMREAAKEEDMLRKAMAKAQKQIVAATEEQRAEFEAQLAELNQKLQEAEERNQRAISMAQQTRRGHVYIISNVGSFGEDVYKIGLTRRLEPLDRVKELGDASVPFAFDVHAIIFSEDAPALETRLHKHFLLNQMNKVNHRKEFFRARIADIRAEIDSMGISAKWTMVADAREYRETLAIERAFEEDPAARDAWTNGQLSLDPVDCQEMVGAAV